MTRPDNSFNPLTPRHQSFDTLSFVLRVFFFTGTVFWIISMAAQANTMPGLARRLIQGATPPMAWFVLYSGLFWMLIRNFPARRAPAYHTLAVLDTVYVTLMVNATGGGNSDYYLAYYLFLAAHTLAFGKYSGALTTIFSAVAYLVVFFQNPDRFFAGDFGMRAGFMFLVYFLVAAMTENEKRDREQLERERRTSGELNEKYEQALADRVEEEQARAAALREKDDVIRRQNEAHERRLSHIAFLQEMNEKQTIEESVLHFSRYLSEILFVDNVDVIALDPDNNECFLYRNTGQAVEKTEMEFRHPLLEAARAAADHTVEWRVDTGGVPAEAALVNYEPAVVRVQPLLRSPNTGVIVVSHSEPCRFDDEMLVEGRYLSNALSAHINEIRLKMSLEAQAETDGLTGLYNHRVFQERLEYALATAARYGQPLGLLLFDIDHFKKFNDTYGHQVGDLVLRELAAVIREQLRKPDIPARYGGEEFTIILPETPRQGAIELAERLRVVVAKHPFQRPGGDPLSVTVSIGVATFPEIKEKRDLIEAADQALYRAKEAGRNRVEG